jgi:hypothetical protein
MVAYQIVNEHAFFTVMLRPNATVDKAMAQNMEVKECLMMQLGGGGGSTRWVSIGCDRRAFRAPPAILMTLTKAVYRRLLQVTCSVVSWISTFGVVESSAVMHEA